MSNKSKTYLLPLLSEMVNFDKKYWQFIKDTYINIEGHENCLAVLHDFSFKNPEFTAYEHKLIKNELFVKLIDIGDSVLYIFKFPEIYMHEYNSFKEGKFSKFGTDAKELVLEFYNHVYKGNMGATSFLLKVNQILFKDKKLKRQIEEELNVRLDESAELSGVPNKLEETFILSNYTKIEK
ncbi:MAG: hypothetical protein ACSLE0_08165 [Chitinophagaceae bacterium]